MPGLRKADATKGDPPWRGDGSHQRSERRRIRAAGQLGLRPPVVGLRRLRLKLCTRVVVTVISKCKQEAAVHEYQQARCLRKERHAGELGLLKECDRTPARLWDSLGALSDAKHKLIRKYITDSGSGSESRG